MMNMMPQPFHILSLLRGYPCSTVGTIVIFFLNLTNDKESLVFIEFLGFHDCYTLEMNLLSDLEIMHVLGLRKTDFF